MPQYPGFNGTSIFISDSIIRRFKPINYNNFSDGSKIDYATGYLLTPLGIAEIYKSLETPENFIEFTIRAGGKVTINKKAVLSVQPSLPINGDGTEINIGGLYQHVSEDYHNVMQRLGLT